MRPFLFLMLVLLPGIALAQDATKCLHGGRILYQDRHCPAGYADITGTAAYAADSADGADSAGGNGADRTGGALSIIGKSPAVRQQEQEFLAQREQQERQYQARLAEERRSLERAERGRLQACLRIERRVRANAAATRRARGWDGQEERKRTRRELGDAQRWLGCRG